MPYRPDVSSTVQLRLALYDPTKLLPYVSNVYLTVNSPPAGGHVSVSPAVAALQFSMESYFQITAIGYTSLAAPLTYQFSLYQ